MIIEEVMVLGVRSFFLFLFVLFYYEAMCKPLTAGLDFLISKTVSKANTLLLPLVQSQNHL